MEQSSGEGEQGKVLVHRLEDDVKRCTEHENADTAKDDAPDAEADVRFVRQDVTRGLRGILDSTAHDRAELKFTYSHEDQGRYAGEACNLRGPAL